MVKVAPGVSLLDALISPHRFWYQSEYADTIDAINWAADSVSADIINISMGWGPWEYDRAGLDPMSKTINHVVSEGKCVVVVAAGNSSEQYDQGVATEHPEQGKMWIYQHDIDVTGIMQVTLWWKGEDSDLDLVLKITMVKKSFLAVLIGCLVGLEDLEVRRSTVLIMNKLCIDHKCRVN